MFVCQSGNVCQVGEEWKSDKIKVIPPLRGLSKSSISGSSIIVISNNITITKQCNHCNTIIIAIIITIIIIIINVFPPFRDLSKNFSSESSCRPKYETKKQPPKERTHTYRITLPKAQRTRGLSSYHKITVHSSQILKILQFQNLD